MEMPFEKLGDLVKLCFSVWVHKREVKWAKWLWQILAEQGFTTYENDDEKFNVFVNYICLSFIYKDFCLMYIDLHDYYEEDDYLFAVKDVAPELSYIADRWESKVFIQEANCRDRRALIGRAIWNWYESRYKASGDAHMFFLEDIISTVRGDGSQEFELMETPLEFSKNPDLFNEIQAEKETNIVTWFANGCEHIR
jgi:hypothetical protein